MTRVTVVVNDLPGRSEAFLATFARFLVDGGFDVTVLALRPGPGDVVGLGSRVRIAHALPPLRSRSGPPAALAFAGRHPAAVRRAVRRHRPAAGGGTRPGLRPALLAAPILATRPDVVHFSFSGIAVAYEHALPLLEGCRLVTSCRGSAELVRPLVDPGRRSALGRVLGRMDAIHAVSTAMAEAVVAMGASPASVSVVRPAVDLDRFSARSAPPPPGGSLHIVAVGRLVPTKGHDDLVSAVGLLRRDGIDVRLTVVGGGPHEDALVGRAHLLGVADRVVITGALAPEAVAEVLAAADVFVSASLSEGISNAMLEAMAVALPVVVTDVGGVREVVTDGADGVVVPPGDPSALRAALARLAADPAARVALASAGRQRVEQNFSLDRQRTEWAEFYATHLGVGAGAGDRPSSPESER